MALVCQNRFRNCEIPCGMELWLRNQEFSRFIASQPFRSCELGAPVLRGGTRVPKSASQLRKFSQRSQMSCGMIFSLFTNLKAKESCNWWVTRSILGFRQQKSNGKYLPISVANIGRLQEPFRRRKMVSARFHRHPRGLRNNFATPSYLHRAAKFASTLRFQAFFLRYMSGNFRRKHTLLYKKAAESLRNKRVISQHFAKCFLQLGVIGLQEGSASSVGDGIGEGSGDCSVKSMGSELSTLGLFCSGRPPDLVRLFLRFEGDEDLAPRVRAISGYRNLADVANRRSKMSFSQQLRSAFRSCEMEKFMCCEVALVCQNHFRNCEIPCGMRLLVRNLGFTTSQCVSQLPNGCYCTAKWHSCAKFAFAAAKYPRRDFYSVAEWFCSIMLISQKFP
uniref:Uncharacterized protein n=1 Tax=Vitis vinifera TaxID=29760 RepID=A5BJ21_VITVI|nr:hypothetical protein VITISV_037668 [Vitis vinifera]